jgi:hypothetical protein
MPPAASSNGDHPSIIIVEVIGYGGGDACDNGQSHATCEDRPNAAPRSDKLNYNPNGMFRVLGNGTFGPEQIKDSTEEERQNLNIEMGRNNLGSATPSP